MARFFSMIYGVSLVAALVAGGAAQSVAHRPSHRPRPPRNMDSQPPDQNPNPTVSMTGQTAPVVASQYPQARPTPPQPQPQATAPTPSPTPDPGLQVTENLPPTIPAQVTYENGMLTVQAMNSTLGALLMAIRSKTGIQFEGLEGSASERVVISMGPAPEGEVLNAILRGSRFDYVVLDRPDSPGTVQRVLLTPRGGATAAGGPPHPTASGESDDDDVPDEQSSGDPEPQNTPAQPPPPQPAQLMQQLQQMQERQRLQQQQQQQQQAMPPQNQAPIKSPPIPQ